MNIDTKILNKICANNILKSSGDSKMAARGRKQKACLLK
jgi:hypothetical protein